MHRRAIVTGIFGDPQFKRYGKASRAIFQGADDYRRLDWTLLQSGAVNLYHRPEILSEDVAWLVAHSCLVREFDCTAWQSEQDFHNDVCAKLTFPGWYGQNLDAFSDCLCDIEIPDEGGCALVFYGYDLFAAREPQPAQWILEAIQDNSHPVALAQPAAGIVAIR